MADELNKLGKRWKYCTECGTLFRTRTDGAKLLVCSKKCQVERQKRQNKQCILNKKY